MKSTKTLFVLLFLWSSTFTWAQKTAQQFVLKNIQSLSSNQVGYTFILRGIKVQILRGSSSSVLDALDERSIWIGKDKGSPGYCDVIMEFSEPLYSLNFPLTYFNNDQYGLERVTDFKVYDIDYYNISATSKFNWVTGPESKVVTEGKSPLPGSTIFNSQTRTITATTGHWGATSGGRLYISSDIPFRRITFRQELINGKPNGVVISGDLHFSSEMPPALKAKKDSIEAVKLAEQNELEKQAIAKKKAAQKNPVSKTKPAQKAAPKTVVKTHEIDQFQNLQVGEKIKLSRVFFNQSTAELLAESYAQLDSLVLLLKSHSTVEIELQGHTDNVGAPMLNQKLSEQRVAVVKKYLTDKGVASNRLAEKGFGGSFAFHNNDTEEGRQLNRRVEFVITKK